MALPKLTDEQRQEALEKARAARTARAKMIDDLKMGQRSIASVIDAADTDKVIAKTKVMPVIMSQPGYGKVKAAALLQELGIAENRTLGGLGVRQKTALKECF